ncbi:MAG: Transposase [Candidatus Omnitrophica bacterium ADurb.Bin277]|jgi:transposase|nr:MAG: Transposase [Candidatus Omnitrophica bacterium ADurb.Bin277]
METATQELEKEEVTATPGSAAKLIREVKYRTRKRFSAEEKIRIVLEGFRKEVPVSELCRKENISSALYYSWLKDFMEAGKACLKGDSVRGATKSEVSELKAENSRLKEVLADQILENQIFKKSLNA